MKTLLDLVHRDPTPAPWGEAENIPWNEPGFSARMLDEHLASVHDQASRRAEKIDAHVAWLQDVPLARGPARVLDLACGPGLYAERLAALGHEVLGIDYSPASIAYARGQAQASGSACRYVEADLREADFEGPHDLVMLVYGEFNVFPPDDVRAILGRARAALAPGGGIVIEAHTLAGIEEIGTAPPRWSTAERGLFGDEPYLWLEEGQYHAEQRIAVKRHIVVKATTGEVERFASTYQGWSEDEYRALLEASGFGDVSVRPSLAHEPDPEMAQLQVWSGVAV